MKAIETAYKGYRFRSRLEARWAVFLDSLGTRWEYEPQGYTDGIRSYLPDFLIADRLYLEVKPDANLGKTRLQKETAKWEMLVAATGLPLLVVFGKPVGVHETWPGEAAEKPISGGVLYTREPDGCILSRTANVCECRRCGSFAVASHWCDLAILTCGAECEDAGRWPVLGEATARAATAARSARFEHGQSGAPV